MTDENKLTVNLPFFPGFYESSLSSEVDHAQDSHCEYAAEREADSQYYPDEYWPKPLRLDQSDHNDILYFCSRYSLAYAKIAQWYCEAFDTWAAENLGTPAGSFEFESMDSPREYNFATDRVYVTCPESVMQGLLDNCDKLKLAAIIKARFTSRDGFISFYDSDIADWQFKPLDELDHNELGTILIAAMGFDGDGESDDFRWQLYESTFGDEGAYRAWQDCVNWPEYESRLAAKRAEKLAQFIEDDCEAAGKLLRDCSKAAPLLPAALSELDNATREAFESANDVWADTHYRCPYTLDLFA